MLLLGETGAGKELFARGIHYAGSNSEQPFVAVNCAAIPENLLESELFGHERGAFTDARKRKSGLFELAGGGTLFLDEVHQMPLSLQPKILRVLESRRVRLLGGTEEVEIRCRLMAAANPLLEQAVASGAFREDLFYRLNVFTITLPPLRERKEDIGLIARQILAESVSEHGRVKVLSPAEPRVTGRPFDESPYFRQVSQFYGTDHYEFDFNPDESLADTIETLSFYSDEPSADAGAVPVRCRSHGPPPITTHAHLR